MRGNLQSQLIKEYTLHKHVFGFSSISCFFLKQTYANAK